MEKKEAFEVVLALIAAGKLPVPSYSNEKREEWAANMRATVESYARALMKAPEPKL